MYPIHALLLVPSMALAFTLPDLLQPLAPMNPVEHDHTLVQYPDNTYQYLKEGLTNVDLTKPKAIVRLARHADNTSHNHTNIFGIPSVDLGGNMPVRRFNNAVVLLYKIPVLVKMIPSLLPHHYKRPNFDHYSDRYETYDTQLKKEHRNI